MNAIVLLCEILVVSHIAAGIGTSETNIVQSRIVTDASGLVSLGTCTQSAVDASCSQSNSFVNGEASLEPTFVSVGVDVPFNQGRGPSHAHAGFSRASTLDSVTRYEGRRFQMASQFLCDRLGLQTQSARRSFLAAISGSNAFRTPLSCRFATRLRCSTSTYQFRTADGSCNNLRIPRAGQAGTPFPRFLVPQYDDGVGSPRIRSVTGRLLPSARTISRVVHPDSSVATEAANLTHIVMQWAQWMDHDIDATPMVFGEDGSEINCCERDFTSRLNLFRLKSLGISQTKIQELVNLREGCFPIRFPFEQRFGNCMNFVRSLAATPERCHFTWREQRNGITSYIDNSNIYGSSLTVQRSLRAFRNGLLKVQDNPGGRDLLPADIEQDSPCVVDKPGEICFRAGDARNNEFVGLTAFHTMWLREHNRVARILDDENPTWSDERVFQESKRVVNAFNQHITYNEWLPIILGPDLVSRFGLLPQTQGFFTGYNPRTRADIRNAFATAAFRMGHSYINSQLTRVDDDFNTRGFSPLIVGSNFFRPGAIFDDDQEGPDSILRGLTVDRVQGFDRFVTSQVTERLFEDRFAGTGQIALDLASLNIQRGRDHGLPGYLAYRRLCGLSSNIRFFSDLPDHPLSARSALSKVYANVRDIDLFSGGLSESPLPGSLIGPTFGCIIAAQFRLLKQGDRFYYENKPSAFTDAQGFTSAELAEIRKVSLARILCDNAGPDDMQPRAFVTSDTRGNDRGSCRRIAEPDIRVFNSNNAKSIGNYYYYRY